MSNRDNILAALLFSSLPSSCSLTYKNQHTSFSPGGGGREEGKSMRRKWGETNSLTRTTVSLLYMHVLSIFAQTTKLSPAVPPPFFLISPSFLPPMRTWASPKGLTVHVKTEEKGGDLPINAAPERHSGSRPRSCRPAGR